MTRPAGLDASAQALGSDPSLELLPAGAAILDGQWRLRAANAGFLLRCCAPGGPGAMLLDLLPPLGEPPAPPAEGGAVGYLAVAVDGTLVEVRLRRSGAQVGVVLCEGAGLFEARHRGLQDALLALSREVALAVGEDEMVGAIARCLRLLFPGWFFCVRIVEPRTLALTSLYAEGLLTEVRRGRLSLTRAAAEAAHLAPQTLDPDRVALTEIEPLVFVQGVQGFARPLVAAGQFFGLVNLEHPGATADPARDERLLVQVVNQAAVGLRNAKLIEELTFVREHLEELLEHANALILAVDLRMRVTVFNRALVRLTGVGRAEALGQSALGLSPEAERPRFLGLLEKGLGGGPVDVTELVLQGRSGAEVRVALSTAPVRNAAGEVEGLIAIGQDLSRQRALEGQVVQAEKLATLGQLAAGVVHEINNPLTSIRLCADALLQAAAAGRVAGPADVVKLGSIRESAERIHRFARDLTSYTRPAAERPEEVDLHGLLDQAARYCDHSIRRSRATLSRSYAEGVPPLRAVRANLVQVFVNLLTNACQALPEGGGEVALATRVGEGGVEVAVSDGGTGIAVGDLARVFAPFFTTKPEGQGTGLGLTIVQNLVEKHGGSVRVTCSPGKGTTFRVWLPLGGG